MKVTRATMVLIAVLALSIASPALADTPLFPPANVPCEVWVVGGNNNDPLIPSRIDELPYPESQRTRYRLCVLSRRIDALEAATAAPTPVAQTVQQSSQAMSPEMYELFSAFEARLAKIEKLVASIQSVLATIKGRIGLK